MGKYFEPDHKGLQEILLGEDVEKMLAEASASTAANVHTSHPGLDVVDESYEFHPTGRASRRAARSVTVRHPQALGLQARDGLLTKAAASAGLEVTDKAPRR